MHNGKQGVDSFADIANKLTHPVGHGTQISESDLQEKHAQFAKEFGEQVSRYGMHVEFLGALGAVRIELQNTLLTELHPPVMYIPLGIFLKVAGNLLANVEFGAKG